MPVVMTLIKFEGHSSVGKIKVVFFSWQVTSFEFKQSMYDCDIFFYVHVISEMML